MFGGGQIVAKQVRACLSQYLGGHHEVIILGSHAADQIRPDHIVPYTGRYNSFSCLLNTARNLRSVLTSRNYVVVHTHGWDADIITALALLRYPATQIVHLHITAGWLVSKKPVHRLRRLLTRALLGRGDKRFIAVSKAVRDAWHPLLGANKIEVVHNAVDTDHFTPLPPAHRTESEKDLLIGVAARLAPMKGLEHVIEAVGILKANGVSVRLLIAGDGPLRSSLEKQAIERGVGQQIEFLGFLNNVRDFLQSLDVFVLPSVSSEGLPLSVLEAMASGLPVVASDVGGTAEAVRNDVDGFIIEPGCNAKLAAAIRTLAEDSTLRWNMGQQARARAVEKFSLPRFGAEISDLYSSVERWDEAS